MFVEGEGMAEQKGGGWGELGGGEGRGGEDCFPLGLLLLGCHCSGLSHRSYGR